MFDYSHLRGLVNGIIRIRDIIKKGTFLIVYLPSVEPPLEFGIFSNDGDHGRQHFHLVALVQGLVAIVHREELKTQNQISLKKKSSLTSHWLRSRFVMKITSFFFHLLFFCVTMYISLT